MANPIDFEFKTVVMHSYTLEEIGKVLNNMTINEVIKQLMDCYMFDPKYHNITIKYEDNLIKVLGDRIETIQEKYLRELKN